MTDATLSVSDLLKEARLQKGRALNDIATELKIKSRYLEALEAGTYEDLPPPAFSAGFVRSYATLLGLDGCALAREFRCEMGEDCEKAGLNFPEPVAESRIPGRVVLVSGACAMLAIYFGWIADFGTPSFAESTVEPVPAHLAALGAQQTGSISDALPSDQTPKSQHAVVRETAPSTMQQTNPSVRTALMAALPRSLDKTPAPKFITTATNGFDTASRPQSEPESTKTQAGNALWTRLWKKQRIQTRWHRQSLAWFYRPWVMRGCILSMPWTAKYGTAFYVAENAGHRRPVQRACA
ncbi:hypothetical protein JCM17845_16700 [Iodidimonas gelatinilytica]|uniref:HTH cro/C1-type domain-containing protein n=1 Tax=Iodidimonas gelatinilytica TaxID=1236966 RepID=A0A5A7MZ22_9PROT|nr:helix-turn-helix domain-containing protein [Iodidimonas gelatinilytica]GER01047.1 hypothetical protein JCM17845_16700 [Iodidimonas gelatinilytica]